MCSLFIILFLHQTTTFNVADLQKCLLFIILFLHQTTTKEIFGKLVHKLFIILFLHQTTTQKRSLVRFIRCLSSCSYIKPQLSQEREHRETGCLSSCSYIKPQPKTESRPRAISCLSSCSYIKPQPIAVNLLAISKILRFELLRNGRAGRFLLQIY